MVKRRSLARRHMDNVMFRTRSIVTFMSNYRILFFAITTIAVLTVMLVSAATRGTMNKNANEDTSNNEKNSKGNSVMTIYTNGSQKSSSGNTSENTKIIVNNQQIPVPSNGSYSKTYVDENGTTHVTVENHSSDSGSGTSVSTTTNVNSTSQSVSK